MFVKIDDLVKQSKTVKASETGPKLRQSFATLNQRLQKSVVNKKKTFLNVITQLVDSTSSFLSSKQET